MMRSRFTSCPGRPGAGEEGVALLLALLFVTLLSAIVVTFCYETEVDASLAGNDGADFEAYVAAKSAVAIGLGLLAEDVLALDEFSSPEFDNLLDIWAETQPQEAVNEAMAITTVRDEYGKLNLNALFHYDEGGEQVEHMQLVEALGLVLEHRIEMLQLDDDPKVVADLILDWLDEDDEIREEGGEDEYYEAYEIPFQCKDAPMDSIEELLKIMSPELYFGVSSDPALDAEDDPEEMTPEEEIWPLNEIFTVHGEPTGRINLMTASPELVYALAGPMGLNPDEILSMQLDNPAIELSQININVSDEYLRKHARPDDEGGQAKPGAEELRAQIKMNLLTLSSQIYRIHGDGKSQDAQVRIEAFVWRNPGIDIPGTELYGVEEEPFRILDWRVIR